MSPGWEDVGCACIPVGALTALADLRGRVAIRVGVAGDRAWLRWEPGSEPIRQLLLRRILPLPGAEVFVRRGESWYRPGRSLPAFEVPVDDGWEDAPLEQVLLPRPMRPAEPVDAAGPPLCLRLVRDQRGHPRPAAAVSGLLDRLAAWAEGTTTARLAGLRAAWTAGPPGQPGRAEVLVLGPPGSLPEWPDAARYWGAELLVPLGFRPEPDLPEPAVRHAVGARAEDLVVLDGQGYELIDRAAFQPLTRAGIRLARAGSGPGPRPASPPPAAPGGAWPSRSGMGPEQPGGGRRP